MRGYTKIAVWGRSMGAVTALMLKPTSDLSAFILDSPFSSLRVLSE